MITVGDCDAAELTAALAVVAPHRASDVLACNCLYHHLHVVERKQASEHARERERREKQKWRTRNTPCECAC